MTKKGPTKRLFDAVRSNNVAGAKAACDAGAEVNAEDYADAPLHWAAVQGHTEVAQLLLKKGANISRVFG
jgi:ankyrin repeat protein